MRNDIYEPFLIAKALGDELDAPAGSAVYVAVGVDTEGQENFYCVYSSREKALLGLRDFAVEELSYLEYDAPWLNMSYDQREQISSVDFVKLSDTKLRKWLQRITVEEAIDAFWNPSENPLFSGSWNVNKVILK